MKRETRQGCDRSAVCSGLREREVRVHHGVTVHPRRTRGTVRQREHNLVNACGDRRRGRCSHAHVIYTHTHARTRVQHTHWHTHARTPAHTQTRTHAHARTHTRTSMLTAHVHRGCRIKMDQLFISRYLVLPHLVLSHVIQTDEKTNVKPNGHGAKCLIKSSTRKGNIYYQSLKVRS